jgi:hypothetical protein
MSESSGGMDERRELVHRVLQSTYFRRTERLSAFLSYICDCAFEGRTDEISEQLIGFRVFGRSSTYSTAEDNIVRTHARLLRQRLDTYFEAEGRDEAFRIQVPKGSYIPVFTGNDSFQDQQQSLSREPPPVPVPKGTVSWNMTLSVSLISLILGVLVTIGVIKLSSYGRRAGSSHPAHRLWATLFSTERPTLIVVGDAGVLMYQNLSKKSITVDQYSFQTYEKSAYAQYPADPTVYPLPLRRYTSFNEVEAVRFLTSLPEAQNAKVRLVFARDLRADDLRHNNLILLGGPGYDPWEMSFKSQLNFLMQNNAGVNGLDIINLLPKQGEEKLYSYRDDDAPQRGYALISLVSNLAGDGHVLIIQGTTASGDGMATEFLESGKEIAPILNEANRSSGLRNFEVLIASPFAGTSWSSWTVLAHRVH